MARRRALSVDGGPPELHHLLLLHLQAPVADGVHRPQRVRLLSARGGRRREVSLPLLPLLLRQLLWVVLSVVVPLRESRRPTSFPATVPLVSTAATVSPGSRVRQVPPQVLLVLLLMPSISRMLVLVLVSIVLVLLLLYPQEAWRKRWLRLHGLVHPTCSPAAASPVETPPGHDAPGATSRSPVVPAVQVSAATVRRAALPKVPMAPIGIPASSSAAPATSPDNHAASASSVQGTQAPPDVL